MKQIRSGRRKRFEEDTFPHLEALWRTALWLTDRGDLAEDLILRTMIRAYREWPDSGTLFSSKARLFRMLAREFLGFGDQRRTQQQSKPIHSENTGTTAGADQVNRQVGMAEIKQSQLMLLARSSDSAFKGAIARFRPHSRLMLILLYRERFSYAEIAYITDNSENTTRAMLMRLRGLATRYILETTIGLKEMSDGQPAVMKNDGEFGRLPGDVSSKVPLIMPHELSIDLSAQRWENEGGAVGAPRVS